MILGPKLGEAIRAAILEQLRLLIIIIQILEAQSMFLQLIITRLRLAKGIEIFKNIFLKTKVEF
jgi:hypothetical protein